VETLPAAIERSSYSDRLEDVDDFLGPLWLAVPKKKVTRGKKRMKTTVQKRIKLKKNICIDRRTGEMTLMHKLPFNWKEYLPRMEDFGLTSPAVNKEATAAKTGEKALGNK